jgi:hypothetical protein
MFLWYIYILLLLLNLVFALIRWGKLRTPIKWLFGLLCWVFLIEIFRKLCDEQWKTFGTHLNIPIEMMFQFLYFYYLLNKKKRIFLYGGLTFFFTALFVAWNVDNDFFWQKNFIDGVFMDVCITLWTGLFFYELIQKPIRYNINIDGNFWVNCGNILYYPGTILLFGLNRYLESVNPELWQNLRPLNYFLNLLIYILYLIAFIMDRNKK